MFKGTGTVPGFDPHQFDFHERSHSEACFDLRGFVENHGPGALETNAMPPC